MTCRNKLMEPGSTAVQPSGGWISYFTTHKRKKAQRKKKPPAPLKTGSVLCRTALWECFGRRIWNQFPCANVTANKVSDSVPNTRLTLFYSFLPDAVARHSIPKHHASKSDVKGAKKSVVKVPEKVHIRSKIPYPHKKTFYKAGPGLNDSEMEVIGHVTKKRKRSESKKRKKRKRHLNVETVGR